MADLKVSSDDSDDNILSQKSPKVSPKVSPKASPSNDKESNNVMEEAKHESSENFFTERGELKEDEEVKEQPYDLYDTDLGELQTDRENERYQEFKVSKPQKVGSVFVYEVCGYDKEGDFKEMKRYSDFHKLRMMLVIRFPGFNIPAIPAK